MLGLTIHVAAISILLLSNALSVRVSHPLLHRLLELFSLLKCCCWPDMKNPINHLQCSLSKSGWEEESVMESVEGCVMSA